MVKKDNIYLSIIITCYNEERKIEKDIVEAYKFARKEKLGIELIVTDDNSKDKTVEIVKKLQKIYKNLVLVENLTNHGKGFGIKQGVMISRGLYILHTDAGYCVPYKEVIKGLKTLEKGCDLAIGSRGMKESVIVVKQPLYRQIGSRFFWLLLKLYVGLPASINDTQCGFKVYKRKVAKKIYNNLFTSGFTFDIEVLLKAQKLKYKLGQFPVEWTNDFDTRLNPVKGTLRIFKELRVIKRKLRNFSSNDE